MTEPIDLDGLEKRTIEWGSFFVPNNVNEPSFAAVYPEELLTFIGYWKAERAELRALRAENQRLRETHTTSRVVDMPDGQRSIVIEQGVETLEFKYEELRKAAKEFLEAIVVYGFPSTSRAQEMLTSLRTALEITEGTL